MVTANLLIERSGTAPLTRRLTVGILHLGDREHGIQRYGRILAGELRRIDGVSVLEHEATFPREDHLTLTQAAGAVRGLAAADVAVIPYSRHGLWAPRAVRVAQLLVVHAGLRRRTVAVLHDVYGSGGGRSERWSLALNAALPGAVVLHGEHERPALDGLPGARRATVIPHFIEQRQQLSRGAARELLQVDPASRVLGMVGWIHQRKNCELAIRALSLLGPEVRLWLVGAPPAADQTYLQGLLRLAAELGVSQRVLITGYVSERELELRVAALDVGLCPYREASASGSMSTLLSAHRAVVASDIALARELRELAPQAISIFGSFQPQALAAAIDAMLGRPPAPQAFDAVLADRNPALTATRYLQVLRRVASGSAGNPA